MCEVNLNGWTAAAAASVTNLAAATSKVVATSVATAEVEAASSYAATSPTGPSTISAAAATIAPPAEAKTSSLKLPVASASDNCDDDERSRALVCCRPPIEQRVAFISRQAYKADSDAMERIGSHTKQTLEAAVGLSQRITSSSRSAAYAHRRRLRRQRKDNFQHQETRSSQEVAGRGQLVEDQEIVSSSSPAATLVVPVVEPMNLSSSRRMRRQSQHLDNGEDRCHPASRWFLLEQARSLLVASPHHQQASQIVPNGNNNNNNQEEQRLKSPAQFNAYPTSLAGYNIASNQAAEMAAYPSAPQASSAVDLQQLVSSNFDRLISGNCYPTTTPQQQQVANLNGRSAVSEALQFASLHSLSAVASALQHQQLFHHALNHHHVNHHQQQHPPASIQQINEPQPQPRSRCLANKPATSYASHQVGNHHHQRRPRELRKCRRIYGIEQRSLWCTQCKWKKACSRFCDPASSSRLVMGQTAAS